MKFANNNYSKTIVFSVFGNALEFFDFTICGVFIQQIAASFFPQTNPIAALFGSIFAFSAAFFTRPLGAILFGYIGDKYGRKKVLSTTIILMGIPTFIIGVLPGYSTFGVFAPAILVLCRLLQGLCTGGEYNGAAVYALENMVGKRTGLVSGLISSSCVLGALTATIIGFLINTYLPADWGWRVAFIFGSFAAVFGYFFRKKMAESHEFDLINNKNAVLKNPLKGVFENHKTPFLKAVVAGAFNGALSYTLFSFLSIYLTKFLGFKIANGLFVSIFGMAAFMVSCVVFGFLSDSTGAKKSILYSVVASIFVPFIVFSLLQGKTMAGVILGQIMMGVLVGSFVGPSHSYLQGLFKTEVRYTGIAFGFSLGMALTGGTTMMLMTYVLESTGFLYAPAFILFFYAIVSMIVLSYVEKSKDVSSDHSFMKSGELDLTYRTISSSKPKRRKSSIRWG